MAARAAALAGAQTHLDHALRLEQEGLISRAERLHAEVALAEADRQCRHARGQLEIARTALALFLDLEREPATLSAPPVPDAVPLPDTARLRRLARDNHPLLGTLDAKRAMAAEGVRAEQGRLYPELFAFGRRELVTSDLTILEPEWAVGLGVNWPLLDRTDRVNRLRAARLREREVAAMAEQARRDLETLVESRALDARQAADQYAALGSLLELARENLRVRERAFAEGLATSLEVVDARVGLAQAETARAAARYLFTVHYALLLEAAGCTEEFAHMLNTCPNIPPQP